MGNNTLICRFTNTVHSSATTELLEFLTKQGIPWNVFKSARKPISEERNGQGPPLLAEIIERQTEVNVISPASEP